MLVLRDAALREAKIVEAIKALGDTPFSIKDLYEKPDIRILSKGMYSVRDTLNALNLRKVIYRAGKRHRDTPGGVEALWIANSKKIAPNIPTLTREFKGSNSGYKKQFRSTDTFLPPTVTATPKADKPQITVTEHMVCIELSSIRITVEV